MTAKMLSEPIGPEAITSLERRDAKRPRPGPLRGHGVDGRVWEISTNNMALGSTEMEAVAEGRMVIGCFPGVMVQGTC